MSFKGPDKTALAPTPELSSEVLKIKSELVTFLSSELKEMIGVEQTYKLELGKIRGLAPASIHGMIINLESIAQELISQNTDTSRKLAATLQKFCNKKKESLTVTFGQKPSLATTTNDHADASQQRAGIFAGVFDNLAKVMPTLRGETGRTENGK